MESQLACLVHSTSGTHVCDTSYLRIDQSVEKGRNQRREVSDAIRAGVEDDDRNAAGCNILLKLKIPVDGDQGPEPGGEHGAKQGSVAMARPTFGHGVGGVDTPHFAKETARYALVEQDATGGNAGGIRVRRHAAVARARSISLASSSTAIVCSRETLGKLSRNSSSGSPASR